MKNNYYEEKINQIYFLISEKKYNQAKEILLNELKAPYIPKKYEKKFLEIEKLINKEKEINNINNFSISKDIALDYLFSGKEEKEIIAIEFLREYNLKQNKIELKNKIESWPIEKNNLKAYLFELLVEQDIDVDINYNGIKMNPKKQGTILNKEEVQNTIENIKKLFSKNPSLTNLAIEEFQKFLLIVYPAVPENGEFFAKEIYQIINSMFDKKISLTKSQIKIKELLLK